MFKVKGHFVTCFTDLYLSVVIQWGKVLYLQYEVFGSSGNLEERLLFAVWGFSMH